MDVKNCYKAWHDKTKVDLVYVDSESFQEYFEEEKAASLKRNETIKAEEEAAKKKADEEAAKKKADEEAAKIKAEDDKKEPAEETVSMDDKEPKEPKKPKDYAFAELDNLHNAGVAFDSAVLNSVKNLGAGELSRAGLFYPEIIASMEAAGTWEGLEGYKSIAEHSEVPIKEYKAAVEAVKKAKFDFITFMSTTDGLHEFKDDPNFNDVYLRAIARFKGIPSYDEM